MKSIAKYIFALAAAALLLPGFTSSAQQTEKSRIVLDKTIAPIGDSKTDYQITLESYVTGTFDQDVEAVPVDLILLLDASGSMKDNAYRYDPASRTTFSYNNLSSTYYYKNQDGSYSTVSRYRYMPDNNKYYLYFDYNDVRYYLYAPTGSTEKAPTTEFKYITTGLDDQIWYGALYQKQRDGSFKQMSKGTWSYQGILEKNTSSNKDYRYYKIGKTDDESSFARVYSGPDPSEGTVCYGARITVNGVVYHMTPNGISATMPTDVTTAPKKATDTIWSGTLYTRTSIGPKIDLLRQACNAFVDEITANAARDNVDHRISIIKFAYTHYPNDKEGAADLTEGNHINGNNYSHTEVVKNFKSVQTEGAADELKAAINEMAVGGQTGVDRGMVKVTKLLETIPSDRVSSKVVLVFTDGEPNHGSGFDSKVASDAIASGQVLKGTIYGAKIYTVGVFGSVTDQNQLNAYMSCLSSRYPDAATMPKDYTDQWQKYVPQNGAVGGGVPYYQTSDGSDLASIFKAIAGEATSDIKNVDKTSSAVIDVVSGNFILPAGIDAEHANVQWHVESCTGTTTDEAGNEVPVWVTEGNPGYYYNDNFEDIKAEITGNKLTVTGFDYSKADVLNESKTEVDLKGNWVGPRTFGSNTSFYGNKLVITFKVTLNPDYTGGLDMPSNEATSGLYYDSDGDGKWDRYEPYPIPYKPFPSICIMKDGLHSGESAVFKMTDGHNSKARTIALTQKASNGSLHPCYVVLKRLDGGETYTIEESDWSWLYTNDATNSKITECLKNLDIPAEFADKYDSAKAYILGEGADLVNNGVTVGKFITDETEGITWCVLKENDGTSYSNNYDNSAISVLFHFTNTRSTAGKPARAEAWAHNKFKGGTAASSGTENGGNEEEDI